ncbi:hypothetical protein DFH09DRAFT_1102471 [Mycena vulgaris]|nr:hypothetical protein DFH09DRAFT_1102471 [Mycena vulgaris]
MVARVPFFLPRLLVSLANLLPPSLFGDDLAAFMPFMKIGSTAPTVVAVLGMSLDHLLVGNGYSVTAPLWSGGCLGVSIPLDDVYHGRRSGILTPLSISLEPSQTTPGGSTLKILSLMSLGFKRLPSFSATKCPASPSHLLERLETALK